MRAASLDASGGEGARDRAPRARASLAAVGRMSGKSGSKRSILGFVNKALGSNSEEDAMQRIARSSVITLVLAVALMVVEGCRESPTSSAPATVPEVGPGFIVQGLECNGDIRALELTCTKRVSDPRHEVFLSGDVILGTPYVQLASDNVSYDGSQVFQADVTVQNMIAQELGTLDGTTIASQGIRIFFHTGPSVASGSGTVTASNCDGTADYTGSNQCYHEYDEILAAGAAPPPTSGGTSQAKTWTWDVESSVETFEFTVYVWAPIRYENGWVEINFPGDPEVGIGLTETPNPVVRDRLGRAVDGRTVSWTSSDPSIAAVDPSTGEVTGVAEGTANVCGSSSGPESDGCVSVAVKPIIYVRTLGDPTSIAVDATSTITLQLDLTQISQPLVFMGGDVTWDPSRLDYLDDVAGSIWDLVVPNEDPLGTLKFSAISAAGVSGNAVSTLTFSVQGMTAGCTDLVPTLVEFTAIDAVTYNPIDLLQRAIILTESVTVCVSAS